MIKVTYEIKSVRTSKVRDMKEVALERADASPGVSAPPAVILHCEGAVAKNLAVGESFVLAPARFFSEPPK